MEMEAAQPYFTVPQYNQQVYFDSSVYQPTAVPLSPPDDPTLKDYVKKQM